MSIQYSNDFNGGLNGQAYAVVDIEDIYLDGKNPRFAASTILGGHGNLEQQKIIEYMLQFCNLKKLGESIYQNKGLYLEEMISCYIDEQKHLVVAEGNRRIAVCKILLGLVAIPKELQNFLPELTMDIEKELLNPNSPARQRLQKINAVIYSDLNSAQKYISSKHTHPQVSKWEPFEQSNYYYTQFESGVEVRHIVENVGGNISTIRKQIEKFIVFKDVFSKVKMVYPDVMVLSGTLRPITDKFMPHIFGKDDDIGLCLDFDDEKLQYLPKPYKRDVYNKILLEIGKAFFVRDEAASNQERAERLTSDRYRLSTEEVKNIGMVKSLIRQNVRIPGLIDLINEYNDVRPAAPNLPQAPAHEDNSVNKIGNTQAFNSANNVNGGSTASNVNTGNSDNGNAQNGLDHSCSGEGAPAPQSIAKTPEFFSDLEFEHIDKSNPDNIGLCRVCEEIKKISTYNSNAGYKNFPIASTFLLRSLIEQTLIRQQKKCDDYTPETLANGLKKSPRLEKIIDRFNSKYNAGQYSLFNNDRNLANNFNKFFSGAGTKGQLDTVIHNPNEISADAIFLNSFVNQGAKNIIQSFLNGF